MKPIARLIDEAINFSEFTSRYGAGPTVWTVSYCQGRNCHGETSGKRRPVATHRTSASAATAPTGPLPRSQAFGLPQGPDRHRLRPEVRYRLGGSARRAGLGLWQDVQELP